MLCHGNSDVTVTVPKIPQSCSQPLYHKYMYDKKGVYNGVGGDYSLALYIYTVRGGSRIQNWVVWCRWHCTAKRGVRNISGMNLTCQKQFFPPKGGFDRHPPRIRHWLLGKTNTNTCSYINICTIIIQSIFVCRKIQLQSSVQQQILAGIIFSTLQQTLFLPNYNSGTVIHNASMDLVNILVGWATGGALPIILYGACRTECKITQKSNISPV